MNLVPRKFITLLLATVTLSFCIPIYCCSVAKAGESEASSSASLEAPTIPRGRRRGRRGYRGMQNQANFQQQSNYVSGSNSMGQMNNAGARAGRQRAPHMRIKNYNGGGGGGGRRQNSQPQIQNYGNPAAGGNAAPTTTTTP